MKIVDDFRINVKGHRWIGLRLRFTIFLSEPQILDKQQSGSRPGSTAQYELEALSGAQSVLLALSDTFLSAAELMHLLGLETKAGVFKRTISPPVNFVGDRAGEATVSE